MKMTPQDADMGVDLKYDQNPAQISDDELNRLSQMPNMNEFQRQKLEKDAKKNWDLFYKRNGDRFFKNRYWTRHEFQELFDVSRSADAGRKYLLEIGCGCGDFILPLLNSEVCASESPNLFIYCCDISDEAIDILKSKSIYVENSPHKVKAFSADITGDSELILAQLDGHQVDIVSLIFVLSAIEPSKLKVTIENVYRLLRPGGLILFRDYAIYDKAMLRFSGRSKICDQFFARQDGTRAFFFTKEQLISCFEECNLTVKSIEYVKRETVNNATKDKFTRIFLQAKIMKGGQ